jgi:hypothetical protein
MGDNNVKLAFSVVFLFFTFWAHAATRPASFFFHSSHYSILLLHYEK